MNSIKFYVEPIEIFEYRETVGRQTYTTGKSPLSQLVELNSDIIDKIKQSIASLGESIRDNIFADEFADETEIELSVGITGNGNICILSGSSSMGIKVKLKWKKKENIKS